MDDQEKIFNELLGNRLATSNEEMKKEIEQEIKYKNELATIIENLLIEKEHWWGHDYAGYSGTIVTKNKEVYVYQYYHRLLPNMKEEEARYIKKVRDLTDEEFDAICEFIEKEIANKEFEDQRIYDAGYNITVDYNGTRKEIKNNKWNRDNSPGLYDKVDDLFKKVIRKEE